MSPGRILDSLTEDCRNLDLHQTYDQQASPSATFKPNPYQRAGIRNPQNITSYESGTSPGYNHHHPSSPHRVAMDLVNNETSSSNGHQQSNIQQPISPHVNVPPNAHNFNHIPPPLPPRRPPKKNPHDFYHSQLRQDPDAPTLMPRDIEAPPLPPRTHSSHQQLQQQLSNHQHSNGNTWNNFVS